MKKLMTLVLAIALLFGSAALADANEIEVLESCGVVLPSAENDTILQALESALGIELVMNTANSGDDYRNMLNVRIAGNDLPDVMWIQTRSDLVTYVNEGVLLDLTPYLERLTEVTDFLGEENMMAGYVDGRLYAIAKAPNIPYFTYWIRKDWLENLNLDMPTTVEEFEAVLEAFVNDDPDGNGIADTQGVTSPNGGWAAMQAIFGGYGIGVPNEIYMKNGALINSLYEEAMPQALADCRRWIEKGLVDTEAFTVTDGNLLREKCFQGGVGVLYDGWVTLNSYRDAIAAVNPEAQWVQVGPLQGSVAALDGSHAYYTSGLLAFSADLQNDPEKLENIIRLFNFVSSEEGNRIVSYGIEGRHYNIADGKIVATDLMASEGGYFWAYQFTGRPETEYLSVKFPLMQEAIENAAQRERIQSLGAFVVTPSNVNMTDINRFVEQETVKFAFGQRDLVEYSAFLEELDGEFQYQVYLEDAAAQLNAMGF